MPVALPVETLECKPRLTDLLAREGTQASGSGAPGFPPELYALGDEARPPPTRCAQSGECREPTSLAASAHPLDPRRVADAVTHHAPGVPPSPTPPIPPASSRKPLCIAAYPVSASVPTAFPRA